MLCGLWVLVEFSRLWLRLDHKLVMLSPLGLNLVSVPSIYIIATT